MNTSLQIRNLRKQQGLTQEEFALKLGVNAKTIGYWESGKNLPNKSNLMQICEAFNLPLNYFEQNVRNVCSNNSIFITYRPDVYLSAGYGVEVLDEEKQTIMLDARLLITERGNKINPQSCEIVCVSGNSMSPEYRHGDRVIIDRGDTELLDGHIFAFRYNGQCYVKEINLLGDKIKCISLNKDYDPFYIKKGEEFTVLGRIIPRIRL